MKKIVSILVAVLMMAVLFAGCKNISDNDGGKIEPSASLAPGGGSSMPNDDPSAGKPTIMPELVPSDGEEESNPPSSGAPSTSPEASKAPQQSGSQPPAGGNSSTGGNNTEGSDTAGEGGSANT